ncbi:Calreticulin family-domain-containing protein [Gigaspora rosea]|uniref:Calreticulin family-domain-containing protein n=1 Tax=Gigaspora rosea TaxID=44941 RepID=A0A397UMK4_9GLOM|nr:Calreticulin family-domain-containing protein [Gigaspora rosea]
MRRSTIFFVLGLLTLTSLTSADIYLKETFSDDDWEKRWVHSKHKEDLGKFKVTAGEFYAHEIESRGLQTTEDARFYAISTKFDKIIDNTDKDLVVQYSVKHEQNIDCGGGYVKLLPSEFDALSFKGESLYNIMFGPDICGMNRKVHFIVHHKGENKELKKSIKAPSDQVTHLYTLILKPDHTYKILIDNEEEASGTLEEDFDLLPPEEITDPTAKKPEDWEDLAEIPDPDDHKPEDWVDHPATIPDPDAKKPDDWDDEMDGDWEPPQISNPDYKGEWKPKKIPNPKYKGEWKAPMIPNPDYVPEPNLHAFKTEFIGFDLWQVRSGTIFDNILITDDVETAEKFANETFVKFRDAEKEAKKKLEELEKEQDEADDKDKKDGDKKDDDDDIIDLDVKLGDDGEVKVTKPEKDEKEKEKVKDEKEKEKVKDEKDKEKVKDEKEKESKDKVKTEEVKKEEKAKETKDEKDEMDKLLDDLEEELGLPPKPKKEDHKLPIKDEL